MDSPETFDPSTDVLGVHAYSIGIGTVEVMACQSRDELRDLVIAKLKERSTRAQIAAMREAAEARKASGE